ncbi:hypothetical protein Vadar_012735 [Vaccinium darrowii]|uniref:Uncharacterized protein n=1 Tax=Vaccinium darrowii TaxID=229202 RepID=A0ACB7YVX9_9ERIC|nr:hypothetical protein Vadar_012735 [Vaccinium darrowii]
MSDKQKGLIEAVQTLLPNAPHRFCVRHLYNNFKGNFKGLALKDILWKAARASTVPSFKNAMQEMHDLDRNAYNWLFERPPVNWSRSHFTTYPRCDILLNNLCESFNASILIARDKPIISMLESIRMLLMETVVKKRDAMKKCNLPVCPKVYKRIEKLKTWADGWIPRWQGNDQFEVEGPGNAMYKTNKSCGCRKWDLSSIPCIHAIAALNFLDYDIYDYVHDCYKVDTYPKIYSNLMNPINGRELWPPTYNPTLVPPDVEKRLGRPKKARRREPDEPSDPTKLGKKGIKMTCRLCGKVGHNVRTCKKKTDAATTGGEGQPSAANAPPPPPNAPAPAPNGPTQVVISVLNVNAESFGIPSTTRPTKLVSLPIFSSAISDLLVDDIIDEAIVKLYTYIKKKLVDKHNSKLQ